MRNLLNFISRYSNLIVFIILEAVSVWFLVRAEGYHSSGFFNGVRNVSHYITRQISGIDGYLALREKNLILARENLELRNRLESYRELLPYVPVNDSLSDDKDYIYVLARVVNNSVNKQYNYITLNKGKSDGIEPEMAVAGPDGVAGIIVSVSDKFSYAMSVLNLDFRLSVRIRKSGYFGSLRWDGFSVRQAGLYEIPYHVDIAVGDTIETSGYSAVFPPGILAGTVAEVDGSGGDFYRIVVNLSTDFRKLDFLYIVPSLKVVEQKGIEVI